MINNDLQEYLEKRITQPTVILCFRILLENIITNGLDAGLTKSQISKIFNRDHKTFGVQKFKTDYVLRQTGTSKDAIEHRDDLLFIKKQFIQGLTIGEMNSLVKEINNKYSLRGEARISLYKEINSAKESGIKDREKFILSMLSDRETERKGQAFEVAAFAILKVFYSIRGFELNRFSTIYSNDGGIDYTSQTSIYQVTTLLSDAKFDEDILKAPLKKRIFVFKKAANTFNFSKMENDLVSDYIGTDDLKNHLTYLLSKKPGINSLAILDVMLKEFEREYYL